MTLPFDSICTFSIAKPCLNLFCLIWASHFSKYFSETSFSLSLIIFTESSFFQEKPQDKLHQNNFPSDVKVSATFLPRIISHFAGSHGQIYNNIQTENILNSFKQKNKEMQELHVLTGITKSAGEGHTSRRSLRLNHWPSRCKNKVLPNPLSHICLLNLTLQQGSRCHRCQSFL